MKPCCETRCDNEDFKGSWWEHPVLRNTLLAGIIASFAFLFSHLGFISQLIENLLYGISIPLGGYHWAREGIEKLIRKRVIGIEILMLAATAASGAIGLLDEAAALVVLYGIAEAVEEFTYSRTRHAIRALLNLSPKEARLFRDGNEFTIPAEKLSPGDIFIVRPGESIATDGVIQSGTSSVDESSITGESVPVDKSVGQKVFAASMNRQGVLFIQATARFADNTLSKIIHLVEEAQEQKGRAQQWIERFGNFYTPAILITSLLLAVIPWMFGLEAEWSLRAVTLLVAAAPCALIMSMPVAMAAGIGSAGRRGILIKGGAHLGHLGNVQVVAFDKTGTLTHGKPSITNITAFQGNDNNLLMVAAGLERFSEHPLAQAVLEAANARNIHPLDLDHFEALPGAGVAGVIHGKKWYLGSPDLFVQLGINVKQAMSSVEKLQQEGKTVILVGTSEELAGLIAFRDELRSSAASVISQLHADGIRTVMLTGDNSRAAFALGTQAGIDDIRANLKPESKVIAIQLLQKQYGATLMVGDGVNDAPALAAATCGVAMGAMGSDAAIEAADVALMADKLEKVLEAIELGRKVRRICSQNIIFSISVLAILIPLALLGYLSVTIAVLVHETSEILAVANGLRVLRYPRKVI